MKLLDTDHCIALLRGQLDLNAHVSPQEELATTAISVAELTHGAHRSRHSEDNLARLEVLLSVLVIRRQEVGRLESRVGGERRAAG